jgi:serine/threonine-protein kinase
MSPEQVEGRSLDPRSDIYSLGVTCYHMLVGTPPFLGETALGVAVQHLKRQPKPLEDLRPDLPPALCRIVLKMLAKEPDARHQSAFDLLRELRRLQQDLFADAWPEDLPGRDLFALGLPGASGPNATRQLDRLMKTAAACTSSPRRRGWLWLAAFAAAFGIGLIIARLTTGAPLFPYRPAGGFVSRQPTALGQINLARQLGTEDAWQSVERYYPGSVALVRRAKQQLARLYLRESRYDEALAIFEHFATGGAGDEYRAFGLAGKAAILTLRKRYRESAQVLETLWPMRDKLRDPQMQQLVQTVLKKNRAEVGPEVSRAEWQKWLDDRFGEPE